LLATFAEPKLASFWSLTLPVAPEEGVHPRAVDVQVGARNMQNSVLGRTVPLTRG
jgi:hypothetical protein